MSRVYLGIGGNIGDRRANIERAVELLASKGALPIKVSSIYETEPVGYMDQDWFYNIVAEIETSLEPYELLEQCNHVEAELKRARLIRWGPRTIDIDILLYDDLELSDEKLTIPHPRMQERAFVMLPLYEIAPELSIKGQNIGEIVKNLKGERINRIV